MHPMPSVMLVGNVRPLVYRGDAVTTSSSTCAKPTGVAVGDLVIVVSPNTAGLTLTTASGDAWSRTEVVWITEGYDTVFFTKILNATDVANAWTFSASVGAVAAAWRDQQNAVVTLKATANQAAGSQTTLTLTGYTPASTRGTISIAIERNPTNPEPPAGWTERFQDTVDTSWTVAIADTESYPGGDVVWTGIVGTNGEVGALYDVQ